MAVENVGQAGNTSTLDGYKRTEVEGTSKSLTMTDFYKLLAAQLKYQDADNPMDTSQMMAQMVQTQTVQILSQVITAVNDMSLVNSTTYAMSMVGKEVTVAKVDEDGNYTGEKVKGTVTGVGLGTPLKVYVDGEEYYLSQIMGVGDTEKAGDAGEEGGTEAGGEAGTEAGTESGAEA